MHNILAIFFVIIAVAIVSVGTTLVFRNKPTVKTSIVPPRFQLEERFIQGFGDEVLLWVDTKTGREYITTTRGGIVEVELSK